MTKHCSFDLTDFDSAEAWQEVCAALQLIESARHPRGYFVWRRDEPTGRLEVTTGNHPVSGEYYAADMREPEPGFASYIGASGDADCVEAFRRLVRLRAGYIKEEDPKRRSFI